tara:strand:+ start:10856 stop:11866 length:1011 start_codon:yes stop_codon:yes gene_type:complete
MKILITGGLGTIGSCLVASLINQKHTITIYDNHEIGTIDNLKYYLKNEQIRKIKFIRKDILDKAEIYKALHSNELCYHMAATLGTLNVVQQPSRMLEVNINGSQNVINSCIDLNIPVVICSTSMVYGNNPKSIVDENDKLFVEGNVDVGLWWYAISKLSEESFAKSKIQENPDSKILIVRPFNVVAPIQSHVVGFVFPRFVKAAINNDPIFVYGNGKQMRTFTWAQDFVDSLIELSKLNAWGETINIGGTDEISMENLAKKIVKFSGSKSKINYVDPQKIFNGHFTEIDRRIPNIDKLKKYTKDIYPKTTIDEIILKFIDYYKVKKIIDIAESPHY